MNTREVQQALVELGWPLGVDGSFGDKTKEAVTDFQRGFAFYDLFVDGWAGEQTQRALQGALFVGGYASPHFKFTEFKSKGNGWIKVNRHLIRGLELVRERYGAFTPLSGYRDPIHNRVVGGKPNSQHLYGNAVDVSRSLGCTVNAIRNIGSFSGIGIRKIDGIVVHVDVRHLGPNTTGGTPRNPTVWYYS